MIIGHLSDVHVVPADKRLFGEHLDTYATATRAVDCLRQLNPAPDVVIVSGDLTGHAGSDEYDAAREILDGLGAPYYVIPGNHDRRAPLLAGMPGHAFANDDGFVQYVIDDFDVRLVALDTLDEGNDAGRLCARRLRWLDDTLASAPGVPTLVFQHHPPFATGVWWMDAAGLDGTPALAEVLGRYRQVGLLACGHVHRGVSATVGGVRVALAPSTAFQVQLDLAPEQRPHAVPTEPPTCLVHTYGPAGFVTHTLFVDKPRAGIDVAPPGDWEAVKNAWRDQIDALYRPS